MTNSTKEAAIAMLYDEGMQTRRKVLGDKYVDAALAKGSTDFSRAAQQYVTCNAWEGIWGRPGLEPKHRSLVVIAIVAMGGHEKELAAHTRGALNNGLTEVEIREALLHVMGYGGFPKGLEAFRTAEAAINSWKAEQAEDSK